MNFKHLVERSRSFRRFDQSHQIKMEELLALIEISRFTPSAANRQPLRYYLSTEPSMNAAIFQTLAWAAYLPDWPGPAEGERPTAYIVVCVDTNVAKDWWCDDGIAAQTIILGAVHKGLGGCMIGAIKHEELRTLLEIPPHLKVRLVLALGKPEEEVRIDPVGADGSIRYWRDQEGVHHVPKRAISELVMMHIGD